jgi:hypothetical protein
MMSLLKETNHEGAEGEKGTELLDFYPYYLLRRCGQILCVLCVILAIFTVSSSFIYPAF